MALVLALVGCEAALDIDSRPSGGPSSELIAQAERLCSCSGGLQSVYHWNHGWRATCVEREKYGGDRTFDLGEDGDLYVAPGIGCADEPVEDDQPLAHGSTVLTPNRIWASNVAEARLELFVARYGACIDRCGIWENIREINCMNDPDSGRVCTCADGSYFGGRAIFDAACGVRERE